MQLTRATRTHKLICLLALIFICERGETRGRRLDQGFHFGKLLLQKWSFDHPDEAYVRAENSFLATGHLDEAEKVLLNELNSSRSDPASAALLNTRLAQLYLLRGRFREVEKYTSIALNLVPRYPEALNTVANLYVRTKRLNEASELASLAFKKDQELKYFLNYARICILQYEIPYAFRIFNSIEKKLRSRLHYLSNVRRVRLAYLLLVKGLHRDLDEATELLETVLKSSSNITVVKLIAWARYRQERYEEANSLLSDLINKGFKDDWTYILLAKIQARRGQVEQANTLLRNAQLLNPSLKLWTYEGNLLRDEQKENAANILTPLDYGFFDGLDVEIK